MNKIFTQELKEKLIAHLSSKEVNDIISNTKAAKDTGTFEMIISSEHVDRSGEIVMQDGIDKTYYLKNPIVLQFHDYWSMPIGVTDSLEVKMINNIKCTVAKGRFAPTEDGQEARMLYEAKMLNTASIGFIPKVWGENNTILESQLLEWSFVPVPCNPEAISMLNLDFEKLVKKGLIVKTEEIVEDVPTEEATDEPEKPAEEVSVPEEEVIPPAEETPADDENIDNNVEEATPQDDEKKPDADNVVLPEDQEADAGVADEKAIDKDSTKNARIREKIESLKNVIKELESELEKSNDEVQNNDSDELPATPKKEEKISKFNTSEVDSYINIRQILKAVNNVTSDALHKLNRANSKKNY